MSNFIKPIKCHCCPHIENSQLICYANLLTGFYIRATLALNGLSGLVPGDIDKKLKITQLYKESQLNVLPEMLAKTSLDAAFWFSVFEL